MTSGAVLNVGCRDPLRFPLWMDSYGVAGIYPDVSWLPRKDGLLARLVDASHPSSNGVIVVGMQCLPVGFALPGVTGFLYVSPLISFGPFALDAVGEARPLLAPPAFIMPAALGLTLAFQGVIVDGATIVLSNGQEVRF